MWYPFTEHAVIRAWDRYKINLTQLAARDILHLCKKGVKIKDRRSAYLIQYNKIPMIVALSVDEKRIVTFLTLELEND